MRWKSISFVIAAVELSKYPMADHIFAIAEATRGMFFAGMTIYAVDSEAVLAAGDNEMIGDNKGEHTSDPRTHHRRSQRCAQVSVRASLHGGRQVPTSTIDKCGISLEVARAIMMIDGNGINNSRVMTMVGDTKHLVQWRVYNDKDGGIMHTLGRDKRLIHPVRHDGTGIDIILSSLVVRAASTSTLLQSSDLSLSLLPASSSATNGGNGTSKNNANARFVSLEAKYDKREMTLNYTAKTVATGSGRPEKVNKIVTYSWGEREDYPIH